MSLAGLMRSEACHHGLDWLHASRTKESDHLNITVIKKVSSRDKRCYDDVDPRRLEILRTSPTFSLWILQ